MKKSIKIGLGIFTLLIIVGAVVYSNLTEMRGYRYCEILLEYDDATEVWGTQGLNKCSQADWEQLDFKEIQLSKCCNRGPFERTFSRFLGGSQCNSYHEHLDPPKR